MRRFSDWYHVSKAVGYHEEINRDGKAISPRLASMHYGIAFYFKDVAL